jgi:GntR family transcriptional regulator, rspAB operon transcriptional repressor
MDRPLSLDCAGSWGELTIVQHRAVAVALATRDRDAAVEAMRQHLDTSLQNTLSILERD